VLLKILGPLLELIVHYLVIVFHDGLDCDRRCDDVPEARHPHVSILKALGAKNIEPVGGLEVEAVEPSLRH